MNVHDAPRGEVENLGSKDLSVGNGDHHVGLQALKQPEGGGVTESFGLVDGEAELLCGEFDGRRMNTAPSAGRPIGLGYDRGNVVARRHEAPQRRHGEGGGPDEHQRHQSQHTLKPQGAL